MGMFHVPLRCRPLDRPGTGCTGLLSPSRGGEPLPLGGKAVELFIPNARQATILDLVAKGETNPEIAEGLFVTAEDVKYHIGHMLRLTGCRNRVALTAWWVERRHGNF